jgi:hypothetical protein
MLAGLGNVGVARADGKSAGGLPPLPLFAQATEAKPIPFATPAPGSVVDEEEDENKPGAEKKEKKKEKTIECDVDSQCPDQAVCARHFCKSMRPMTSAILYFHRSGPIGFSMVLPFYFHFWHPKHATSAFAPFFVDHHDNEDKSRDLWVFPIYQFHREPGERTHRIWPLFFYSNYGKEGKTVGLLPFFWSTSHAGVSNDFILPLLFYERRDEKAHERDTLFLPLLLYLRERPGDTLGLFLGLGYYRKAKDTTYGGFLPLVFYSANAIEHRTTVLPLFFEGGNRETGTRYATLLPFFFDYHFANKNHLLVTPIGGTYHDHDAQEDTLALLLPPMIRRDTPSFHLTLVLPIAAYWQNKQSGYRFGFAGPFFYTRDDEGGSDGLFPLFFRFQSYAHHSSTMIAPPLLAAYHRSPELRMGFFGPLYGWSRQSDGAYGGGFLPLFSFAKGAHSHLALLPPLVIYSADHTAGRYHFSLGPFFYRTVTRGPGAGYDAGFFPLLFVSHHDGTRTEALVPLFYHHREPYHERLVLGLVYYDRTCPKFIGDTRSAVQGGVVPLLYWKRSAEHSFTVLFPLFFEARTRTESTWMAGPIFYHRQKLAGAGGDRVSFGVLPLFYAQRSAAESLVVAPLVGYHRTEQRRTLFIGPYVETVASPGQPEQAVTRMFFPLYYFHCSPGNRAAVLFPLFIKVREEQRSFLSVLLLYYGVDINHGETRAHALLPLFFSLRSPGRSTTVFLPFFHSRNDKTSTLVFGLLPLFGYGQDLEHNVLVTPIGFYQRNNIQGHTRSAFLLFWGDFQRNREDFGVFPLFFATRRATARAVYLPPLIYDSRDPAENRSFTLLGLLFFGHKKDTTYGGIVPFIYGRNDGDGGFRFYVFPLLYASHRPQGENWMLTPLFGFEKSSKGYLFYLGPFYFRHDSERTAVALVPLFYDGRNPTTQEHTTLVLPFFFRRATPEKSLTMITPLFWQQRTLTQRVSVLFPLLLDVHNIFRERTTAFGPVIPLFVRLRDEGSDTTTWLFPPILTYIKITPGGHVTAIGLPIFWHFKDPDRQTTAFFPIFFYAARPATKTVIVMPLFGYRRDEQDNRSLLLLPLFTWWRNGSDGSRERVVFPLVWHFKGADRQTTVVFPLYWHAQRPTYKVTVLLPFGAHWTTERGVSTLVLNTYYYKGTGAYEGAWSFHFWPLFSFGRPGPQDIEWTVLSGLFGYTRQGTSRTLKLFFGISVPLQPVGRQVAKKVDRSSVGRGSREE